MRRWMSMLAVVSGLVASGCITGFRHPLGPVEEGFVESRLTGRWSCVSTDDPSRGVLEIIDFDGEQYYLESAEEGKGERDRLRGHATRVEAATFLSVREVGGDQDGTWTVLQYDLTADDGLILRMVAAGPFEDVIDDPDRVRERLASRLVDPQVMSDLLTCRRAEETR